MTLQKLFKRQRDKRLFRLADADSDRYVLAEISADRAHYAPPLLMHRSQFEAEVENGYFTLEDNDPFEVEPPDLAEREEMSDDEREREEKLDQRCENAYEAVCWMLTEAGIHIGEDNVWRRVTAEAARKFKRNVTTCRRWLNVFWRNGCTKYGLRAEYGTQGPMSDSAKKNGRKARPGKEGCKNTKAEIKRMTEHSAKCRAQDLTANQGHSLYLREFHRHGTEGFEPDGTAIVVHDVHYKHPSLARYMSIFYGTKDYVADSISKHGETKHRVNHRPKPGSYKASVAGPLSRVELDFTINSKWLVARNDRARVLGKSVIGAAVDMYSSNVLGVIETWGHESEMTMRLLLENVMTDKVKFCARYGRIIKPEEWLTCYVPVHCVYDRGPGSKGKIGDEFADEFGFGWENVATGDPGQKPGVESQNAKMERLAKARAGWEPRYYERGDEDAAEGANLTIDDDMALLIEDVLLHNNSELPGRYIPPDAAAAGCRTPNEVFIYGMGKAGRFKVVRQDTLPWRVAPPQKAVITGNVLLFRGLEYFSEDLVPILTRAKANGRIRITVRSNSQKVDQIRYRPDPKRRKDYFITCELTQRFKHFEGMTFGEVAIIQEQDKLGLASRTPDQTKKNLAHDGRTERIEKEAKKKTLAAKKAAGLGPKDYHDDNKRIHRAAEAEELSKKRFGEEETVGDSSGKTLVKGVIYGEKAALSLAPSSAAESLKVGARKNKLNRFRRMRQK